MTQISVLCNSRTKLVWGEPSSSYLQAMDSKALANLRRKRRYIHRQLDRLEPAVATLRSSSKRQRQQSRPSPRN